MEDAWQRHGIGRHLVAHLGKGDLAVGGKTARDQDRWICFADEAGRSLRPPRGPHLVPPRPYADRYCYGQGLRTGRLAALVCLKSGQRTRLIFRTLAYHGRKGEPKGFKEFDFARLLDAADQQLGGPIALDAFVAHIALVANPASK